MSTRVAPAASTAAAYAWRWSEYWAPADAVVEFKREVYRSALGELERYLSIGAGHHRACHPYMLASRAHGAGRT